MEVVERDLVTLATDLLIFLPRRYAPFRDPDALPEHVDHHVHRNLCGAVYAEAYRSENGLDIQNGTEPAVFFSEVRKAPQRGEDRGESSHDGVRRTGKCSY